jgi:hypothetical protein
MRFEGHWVVAWRPTQEQGSIDYRIQNRLVSLKNFCPSGCVGMELALARTILAGRILVESENIYTQLT